MIDTEDDIISALAPLNVGVYNTRAPQGAALPHIIFQQVGGRPTNTFCGNTTKTNARIRFSAHADVSVHSTNLIRKAEAILTEAPTLAVSLGGLNSQDDSATLRFVAMQDFSIWFRSPPTF